MHAQPHSRFISRSQPAPSNSHEADSKLMKHEYLKNEDLQVHVMDDDGAGLCAFAVVTERDDASIRTFRLKWGD